MIDRNILVALVIVLLASTEASKERGGQEHEHTRAYKAEDENGQHHQQDHVHRHLVLEPILPSDHSKSHHAVLDPSPKQPYLPPVSGHGRGKQRGGFTTNRPATGDDAPGDSAPPPPPNRAPAAVAAARRPKGGGATPGGMRFVGRPVAPVDPQSLLFKSAASGSVNKIAGAADADLSADPREAADREASRNGTRAGHNVPTPGTRAPAVLGSGIKNWTEGTTTSPYSTVMYAYGQSATSTVFGSILASVNTTPAISQCRGIKQPFYNHDVTRDKVSDTKVIDSALYLILCGLTHGSTRESTQCTLPSGRPRHVILRPPPDHVPFTL